MSATHSEGGARESYLKAEESTPPTPSTAAQPAGKEGSVTKKGYSLSRDLKITGLYSGIAWISAYAYQSVSLDNFIGVMNFFKYTMPVIKDFWYDHMEGIFDAAATQSVAIQQLTAEHATIIAGLVAAPGTVVVAGRYLSNRRKEKLKAQVIPEHESKKSKQEAPQPAEADTLPKTEYSERPIL